MKFERIIIVHLSLFIFDENYCAAIQILLNSKKLCFYVFKILTQITSWQILSLYKGYYYAKRNIFTSLK